MNTLNNMEPTQKEIEELEPQIWDYYLKGKGKFIINILGEGAREPLKAIVRQEAIAKWKNDRGIPLK